ncbi:MAG: MBL fold metallo-hydrolase [Clostridia bacterium]|nr:MBL fold metallo-hydrolase [Clostridia bacterium]
MRIIFHGTSHGVPEPHRRCSSYILEVAGAYYLIDLGTSVTEELRRRGIPMEAVRLAICTHPHGDHTDGVIQFADLLNWYFKQADPLILLPDERLLDPLKTWLTVNDNGKPPREDLRVGVFGAGVAYEDDRLRLTAIPTRHCVHSYAFLIEAEGKRVLFTGDLRHPSVDFPQAAFETELDLLVCELAHFSPADCVPVLDKTKAKRVLHSHINDDRWAAALQEQKNTPHPYEYGAAFDGLELEI